LSWVYFIGRFHVVVLHLPVGILCVAVLVDFLARRPRFASLGAAGTLLWGASALTAIATVALGLAHFSEGGFSGPDLERHRALGVSVAVLATLLWLWRLRGAASYMRWQPLTGVLALLLVTFTGHYGGALTHGPTYLTELTPPALRSLFGMGAARKQSANAAGAQVFDDLVHPLLMLRCGSCHGESTRKGKLSFATYELTMAGGEEFPAVVAGDLVQSELYARVTMPRDSKDAMPKDNKTPLTPEQVKVIAWWIQAGAPRSGTVAELKPPAELLPLIEAEYARLPH
jgi:uncharacterized membrane protein/mono/diheme cytochrome c family protein